MVADTETAVLCSLEGGIADQNCFGHNFYFTALGGRFGYFLFFLLGGGEGGVQGAGRGGREIFYGKSQEAGGVSRVGGGWGGDGSGVCGEFGGGAKYFFSGPKFPPRADADTEKYYFRIISTMILDKR